MIPAIPLLLAAGVGLLIMKTRDARAKQATENLAPVPGMAVPTQPFSVAPGDKWALAITVGPTPSATTLQSILTQYVNGLTKDGSVYVLDAATLPAAGTFRVVLQYNQPGVVAFGQPIPVGNYVLKIVGARKV